MDFARKSICESKKNIITKKKIFSKDHLYIEDNINCHEFFWKKECIPLNIVFEDFYLFIVNKSSNLVVHPGAGNLSGTLLNGIIFYREKNLRLPRAGIVHRLDKNTTGLLIVAKKLLSYYSLVTLLRNRKIFREYDAIVWGKIYHHGIINTPIRRNYFNRTKMMVDKIGKNATTYYKVIAIFRNHTHLRIKLETGRTHQIRVHFSSINHPVLGDPIYFKKTLSPDYNYSAKIIKYLSNCSRQMLHASKISFISSINKRKVSVRSSPPDDMLNILYCLYTHGLG